MADGCGDKDRAQARREQVLAAAEACFQRHGFHSASMAEISRAAGMSVGHIYHYFASKEAIIAAIVAREKQRVLAVDAEVRSHADWGEGIVEQVPRAVERIGSGQGDALLLEVLAEAVRNPGVAALVQQADEEVRRELRVTLGGTRGGGAALSDLDGRMEVLCALFDGLHIRVVRHPGLDSAATARVMQRVMRALLEP